MLTDQILVECLDTKTGSVGNTGKAVHDEGIVNAKGKIVPLGTIGGMILYCQNVLNSLSADDKAALEQCAAEMVVNQRNIELADNETIVETLQNEGMEVNELTADQMQAFVDAIQPMYDEYKASWGTEIFDLATSFNK